MRVAAICQACNPYNEEQRYQKQDLRHHYQQEWKAENQRDVQDGDATEQKEEQWRQLTRKQWSWVTEEREGLKEDAANQAPIDAESHGV